MCGRERERGMWANVEIVNRWDVHLGRSITECQNRVNCWHRTLRELYLVWYTTLLGFILQIQRIKERILSIFYSLLQYNDCDLTSH